MRVIVILLILYYMKTISSLLLNPLSSSSPSPLSSMSSLSSKHILAYSIEELSYIIGGSGKAKKMWSILRQGGNPIDPTNIELSDKVKHTLRSLCLPSPSSVNSPQIPNLLSASIINETFSSCGGIKLLLQLHSDYAIIESVIIPSKDRTTVCVSTQIGCDRGCSFCMTATMGFKRNLTSDEIISQVIIAKQIVLRQNMSPLTNVVYMGMGDAGRNIEAVKDSVIGLTDKWRLRMPQNRLTVSTVGPSPSIFMDIASVPCNIAWSLHSADDHIRKKLVPSTSYNVEELRGGLLKAIASRSSSLSSQSLMISFTLINDINDSIQDALKIAEFCKPFKELCSKLALDLVPYNDIGIKSSFHRPSQKRIIAFQDCLRKEGYFCMVRFQRGEGEFAACGMLATKRMK